MKNSNGSSSSGDESLKHKEYHLQEMGVELEDCDYIVALAGNPNTGKSTVFNDLTGLHQHTGNWPGKTVTRAVGAFEFADTKYKVVDLPGTYSLLAVTEDEEIARDFILFGRPDVTVVVVDATCLERNLNLVLQILEITDRVVVDLNLMDEAKRHNIEIDVAQLSNSLGVPVVPTAARYNKGMDDLTKAIHEVATNQCVPHAYHIQMDSPELKKAVDELSEKVEEIYPQLPNIQWVALRLLDGDRKIIEAFRNGDFADMA